MAQKISVGIDIGSDTIKVIVAESDKTDSHAKPKIIGFGISIAEGMRRGYIVDPEETAKSLRKAIDQAQKTSGYKIDKAYFSIGGAGLEGATGTASISLGEHEVTITAHDIDAVLEACQEALPSTAIRNREIIHPIPLSYKIDGKHVFGKAIGMIGSTLEVKAFFITSPSEHLANLMTTARLADINTIEDVSASSIAGSIALLTKSQRIAGCGLLTIGAETSSFVVFEDDAPVSVIVFSLGSKDVTNDIALAFKVSLEEAERIKISRPESIPYPRKKIEEVVRARLEDIFDLVQGHLKKIGKSGLLPAGILITGGGAQNPYVEDIAKNIVKLPSKKIGIKFDGESKIAIPNAIWPTAYGLSMISMSVTGNTGSGIRFPVIKRGLFRNLKKFFEKLMP